MWHHAVQPSSGTSQEFLLMKLKVAASLTTARIFLQLILLGTFSLRCAFNVVPFSKGREPGINVTHEHLQAAQMKMGLV